VWSRNLISAFICEYFPRFGFVLNYLWRCLVAMNYVRTVAVKYSQTFKIAFLRSPLYGAILQSPLCIYVWAYGTLNAYGTLSDPPLTFLCFFLVKIPLVIWSGRAKAMCPQPLMDSILNLVLLKCITMHCMSILYVILTSIYIYCNASNRRPTNLHTF